MEKIKRKKLLYKSGVEYTDYCINHVKGCSHGCRFPCYAFNMAKSWGKTQGYEDWIQPKIVENALELLEKEIPKHKDKIKFVHLCFSTDPFMYGQPEVTDMSLKIIEKLNKNNIACRTLTKGIYPEELIQTKRYGKDNEYGITLVSLNEDFRKQWEPFTSGYSDRISALKRLSKAGLKTWTSIEPYPTSNIIEQNLEEILESIGFVNKIIFGKLNYNKLASKFQDKDDFYKRCSETVKGFCVSTGKEFHYNRETKENE